MITTAISLNVLAIMYGVGTVIGLLGMYDIPLFRLIMAAFNIGLLLALFVFLIRIYRSRVSYVGDGVYQVDTNKPNKGE